jgi:isopentenyldiphosphate isomerase
MAAAEELFDLCDEWGQPLGKTKPRSLVHRDGDWHRSFHCWLLSNDDSGEQHIVLQRRALDKDTWPGRWDVSVAGHYSADEGLEGGLREILEEVGLHVSRGELILAARRREEARHPNGLIDREVEDIYFLRRNVNLLVLRINREVTAVALVRPTALVQLADGSLPRLTATGGAVDRRGMVYPGPLELVANDLVPRADGYYARVADFATRLASGELPAGKPGWW